MSAASAARSGPTQRWPGPVQRRSSGGSSQCGRRGDLGSRRHRSGVVLVDRVGGVQLLAERGNAQPVRAGATRDLAGILGNDNELEAFVRRHVFGVWHASGTCRMGAADDTEAVVDSCGKVIGIENLYVSDASIMPRLPTANTNIPVVMIAEKISDGLLHA